MKSVIVASQNPVKIAATKAAFERVFTDTTFEFSGVSVLSGVPDQPMGDDETFLGAMNRAQSARSAHKDAAYTVGLEGGCELVGDDIRVFAWMVVTNAQGKIGKARTSCFYLPHAVVEHVRGGMELGHADDLVHGQKNSKQGLGSVGILTNGLIDRTSYYEHALVLALIPFVQIELY